MMDWSKHYLNNTSLAKADCGCEIVLSRFAKDELVSSDSFTWVKPCSESEHAAEQGEAKNTPSNTDYAAAQRVFNEFNSTIGKGVAFTFSEWLVGKRLHAEERHDA